MRLAAPYFARQIRPPPPPLDPYPSPTHQQCVQESSCVQHARLLIPRNTVSYTHKTLIVSGLQRKRHAPTTTAYSSTPVYSMASASSRSAFCAASGLSPSSSRKEW